MTYQEMVKTQGWETLEKLLRPFWETHEDVKEMPGEYVVKASPVHGLGVFASADIEPGALVGAARIDGKRSKAGRYCNHSSQSNAKPICHGNDIYFIARKRIENGAEIFVDYREVFAVNKELHACN